MLLPYLLYLNACVRKVPCCCNPLTSASRAANCDFRSASKASTWRCAASISSWSPRISVSSELEPSVIEPCAPVASRMYAERSVATPASVPLPPKISATASGSAVSAVRKAPSSNAIVPSCCVCKPTLERFTYCVVAAVSASEKIECSVSTTPEAVELLARLPTTRPFPSLDLVIADCSATKPTASLNADTSAFTFSTIASASSATVMVAVPSDLRLKVTPGSTSENVFDSRWNVPAKPLIVNSAFWPVCDTATPRV